MSRTGVKRAAPSRPVSKLSRYLYGVIQGFAAFGFIIVGLLLLARKGVAGVALIVIGVAFGVAAVTNVRLAKRATRSDAVTGSGERPVERP